MKPISHCKAKHGCPPDYEICSGWLDAKGEVHQSCGDPCSYVMMKSGAGVPPFHYRKCLFVGDKPVSKWEDM